MRATKLFNEFFENEKASGITLLICTLLSILLANSSISETYTHFWHSKIGSFSIEHIINDGLMTIFFLLIGLELEREVYIGELSNLKNALLPISAALGGMIIPALIYFAFTNGTLYHSGIGIPMATDIAFAIGILSLLGNKVPTSLKVFLTALAVIDDLGAILIIAIFYSKQIDITYLLLSLGVFSILLVMNRLKVYKLLPYLIGGVLMWYFMLNSGVHATITGVLLAFAIPFENGEEKSISYQLQHWLHKPVSFLILPIFALANTAIVLSFSDSNSLFPIYAYAIIFGLVVGKPLGIFIFSYLSVHFKFSKLPSDLNWSKIVGVGILGGIGFTMSIFITLLAFTDQSVINNAKFHIILASLTAGLLGLIVLKNILKEKVVETEEI
ncbi:Na+/H+ antiporter NhaA [Flavobacterium terrae]|uniref:Na(+)/H(+) antiporter NhaA n=1 Tax=Flavobacterium terrae TaxID=415425 RepID=A0A1M6FPG5_9FLAO|nr:Na+/H+ antiporter NhaA [Flavobacterium terrae]SHI99553.1 sodium/proton antiporter, NhaA family [Flavobacterium terrae]